MQTEVLDGSKLAKEFRRDLAGEIEAFVAGSGIRPKLDIIMVGNNPASEIYVRKKVEACKEVGIISQVVRPFGDEDLDLNHGNDLYEANRLAAEKHLAEAVRRCSSDPRTHGVIVQMPVQPLSRYVVYDALDPEKDVDCFTPYNCGLLMQGRADILPCTPAGILNLLAYNEIDLVSKRVCVISRSDVVGKPLAVLMSQENIDATVTVCHNMTPAWQRINLTTQADVVVVGVGIPGFLQANHVRQGAVVVDVGINRLADGKVVGDVDEAMWGHAGWLSRVPGGVGPLTVYQLLENTFSACKSQYTKGELNAA